MNKMSRALITLGMAAAALVVTYIVDTKSQKKKETERMLSAAPKEVYASGLTDYIWLPFYNAYKAYQEVPAEVYGALYTNRNSILAVAGMLEYEYYDDAISTVWALDSNNESYKLVINGDAVETVKVI